MEKYDIAKSKKALKAAAEITGTKADLPINVILNNMEIYNNLILEYITGDTKKAYLMYQMSSTIFNQLAAFGLVPPKAKAIKKGDDDAINEIIKAVNER
jgi:hypothetical protein